MVIHCNGHKIDIEKDHVIIDGRSYPRTALCVSNNAPAGFADGRDLGSRAPTKEFVKHKFDGIVVFELPAGTCPHLVAALDICGPDIR